MAKHFFCFIILKGFSEKFTENVVLLDTVFWIKVSFHLNSSYTIDSLFSKASLVNPQVLAAAGAWIWQVRGITGCVYPGEKPPVDQCVQLLVT